MVNTSVEAGSMWKNGGTQSFKFDFFFFAEAIEWF